MSRGGMSFGSEAMIAMLVERASTRASLIDVFDRVLDKGIVIDAWVRVSLIGVDLVTLRARILVASFDTYLRQADSIAKTRVISS
jgi:gas vesicle structural protein